ncbi:MAG TPA: AarF/ABC1/UbiB kinase family protein [Solirubrobacteraceae bacterium]|jgi:predicted unusual protein kinase regulating ubiquinone biosynthesis (AarF/ABC1/UbiB family)|nr:AarF/ABC1/UbiB kinase family protein [Solirubrobacteraceae bacterium]
MPAGRIPTSRAARAAKVGKLAATEAARHAGTHAANVARPRAARRRALERRHLETADQILTVLGTMKGAAMKLGQMLSFIDLGVVPRDARPEFQRKLAALTDSAPTVPFERMMRVLEEDLGQPSTKLFECLEPDPIGVASIGQVYKATLKDGTAVAVKLQYPGVAAAVKADMKNLSLMLRLAQRTMPGLDVEALAREIRLRVGEELDYLQEAENQRQFAEVFKQHPFITVPDVFTELSAPRVLVTEFVEGIGFEQIKHAPDATRNRVAEVVYRFFCGALYRRGEFSGDPHPGNFLLKPDGRVAFFDFGLFKRMDPVSVELELSCQRAAAESRAADLHALMAAAGIFSDPSRIPPDELLDYVHDAIGWYLVDEPLTLTPEMATAALLDSATPQSEHFRKFRHQHLPPEHVLARRMELFTLALLGQLNVTANWHRIAREWMYGDPPVTELGELEVGFYERAPASV